jgi:hypothetical protein
MKTSITDPLRIAAVSAPVATGVIGLTLCPGKKDPSPWLATRSRQRLSDRTEVGAEVVVTLVEPHELHFLQVASMPRPSRGTG